VERRAAQVDLPCGARAGDLERAVELVWDPERAHEVAAGPAVNDRQLDALDAGDPVHDLVHGPVAADHDEELGALRRGLAGELRQLALFFREERVALEPLLGSESRDLGPSLSGRAVVGRRVDEEDGFANGRR
jgi:hypothetical protein